MTILLVSSGRRHAPKSEPSGHLYSIDVENQAILKISLPIEPIFREFDDNPRGGMRGCKGIAVRDDEITLSNFSVLFRYDPQWNLLNTITHPACSGIHDIRYQGNSLWVTAARSDLLMQFDLAGELIRYHYMRHPCPALSTLDWRAPILLNTHDIEQGRIDFRDPRTHEKEAHDRAHINGICTLPNGEILVSMGLLVGGLHNNLLRIKVALAQLGLWDHLIHLNEFIRHSLHRQKDMQSDLVVQPVKGKSAVVRIDPQDKHTLAFALKDMTVPSHSLLTLPDGTVVYLNTTEGKVIHYDPQANQILTSTKVTDGFLRGVSYHGNDMLTLGSKQEVLFYDMNDRKIITKMKIISDPNEAVYDIKILPEHYSLPPDSLEEHFQMTTGFKSNDIILKGRTYTRAYP